jgi:predicted nuclease of predicted toxin-antitoxin system
LTRLYADENFPLRVVEELRRLGHDVLTAFEDGRANQAISDEDLLARATEEGRVVITLNRVDFKRLHRQRPDHAGVIICTEDPDRVRQAGRIATALEQTGELKGLLIQVYRPVRQEDGP